MIDQINHTAEIWWGWMWAISWQVGVLIGLVAGIDLLIRRRVWPQVRYALWLLVLAKLILPPTFSLSTSVTSGLEPIAEQIMSVGVESGGPAQQNVQATLPYIDVSSVAIVIPQHNVQVESSQPVAASEGAATATDHRAAAVETPRLSAKGWAMCVWLLGVVVLSVWLAARFRQLRRSYTVSGGGTALPSWLGELVAESARKLKLRRLPRIIVSGDIASPAVFGVLRPTLLLPSRHLAKALQKDTEHVLLHELAHIKRGDLWVHAVYMVLQIVYWFNPLLWFVRRHLQHLRELCCDASVARVLREETCGYRQTILETARRLLARPVEPGMGLLGLFEDSSRLLIRLKWLEKKTWRYGTLRIIIILAVIGFMSVCILPMAQGGPDVQMSAEELVAKIIESEKRIREVELHYDYVHKDGYVGASFDWGYQHPKEYCSGTDFYLAENGRAAFTLEQYKAFDGRHARTWREEVTYRGSQIIEEGLFGTIGPLRPGGSLFAYPRPVRLLGHDIANDRRSFGELLREADTLAITNCNEEIGGHECYLLEARGVRDADVAKDIRVWIDPHRGFRPLRVERYESTEGKNRWKILRKVIDNIRLEKINGVWFPLSGSSTSYLTKDRRPPEGMSRAEFAALPAEKRRKIGTYTMEPSKEAPVSIRVERESVRINEGIAAEKFALEFPKGCKVYDKSNGNEFTVGGQSKPSESMKNNWASFRGPDGSGICTDVNVPSDWDGPSGKGILWKSAVPLAGNSSPIVWDDRVFVSGGKGDRLEVYCFDGSSGKLLWTGDVPMRKPGITEKFEPLEDTGLAAPTMVTDGRRVCAIFVTGDLGCFDFDGKRLWTKSLGIPDNVYGHASSLSICGNLAIVQFDQADAKDGRSKLIALDMASGNPVWETSRPVANSWASPIVAKVGGTDAIITCADPWVIAYDPGSGNELWRAECLAGDLAASPVYANGLTFVVEPYSKIAAIRANGRGDVTKTHIAWSVDEPGPDICSPVSNGEYVFILNSDGLALCFNAADGKKLWEEDIRADFLASPSLVGDKLYLLTEKGVMIIAEASPKYKELRRCELGEKCHASPAFADDRIYIRGLKNLYCISSGKSAFASPLPDGESGKAVVGKARSDIRTIIERLRSSEYVRSGKGTATVVKVESRSADQTSSTVERIVDFRFKGDLTRSDAFAFDKGKRGDFIDSWARGPMSSASYSAGGGATIEAEPFSGRHREVGHDFHPETFSLPHLADVIERVAGMPDITLEAAQDSQGRTRIVSKYKDERSEEGFVMLFITDADGIRLSSWESTAKNLEDNSTYTGLGRIQLDWKKYAGAWYISEAALERIGVHGGLRSENRTTVTIREFTPNVEIEDKEFTLDGLNIPPGTTVLDSVLGTTYKYAGSKGASAERLRRMGTAILMYANDYDDKAPDNVDQLERFFDADDMKWLLENVRYIGKGKSTDDDPEIPVAYDKKMLQANQAKGTHVLSISGIVSFKTREQLEKLGIDSLSWGPEIEGVQARLYGHKRSWREDEIPRLIAGVRNNGSEELFARWSQDDCRLEVDGQWYSCSTRTAAELMSVSAGNKLDHIFITLSSLWRTVDGRELRFTPGEHTVSQAASVFLDKSEVLPAIRPISNPVRIEITPVGDIELVWGEEVNGLRSAVEFTPDKPEYSFGETIDLRFHIQNVSDKTRQFISKGWRQDQSAMIEDEHRNLQVCTGTFYTGVGPVDRYYLKPGEKVVIDSYDLGIARDDKQARQLKHPVGYEFICKGGVYYARFGLHLPNVKTSLLPEEDADFKGKLETGPHKFTVAGVSETNAVPLAAVETGGSVEIDDSKTGTSASPAKWTRVLPDGSEVKLVAVFRPKDDPVSFWDPDGNIIAGPRLGSWQYSNVAGRELAVVLEHPQNSDENPDPDGKFYSPYGWREIDSSKPLAVSYYRGYGDWEDFGGLHRGSELSHLGQAYTLANVEDKTLLSHKQILVKMWYGVNPDIGIRLVAVDKQGKKYPMEAADIWLGGAPKGHRAMYFQFAEGLNKDELSHFILQKRPMALVRFSGFATEPKKAAVQAETEASSEKTGLVWGEAVDGLRAAIEFVPEKEIYSIPEQIDIRFHIQNVSDKPIEFISESYRPEPLEIHDANGNRQGIRENYYSGLPAVTRHHVEPGREVVLPGLPLSIAQDEQQLDSLGDPHGTDFKAKGGVYFVRAKLWISRWLTSGRRGDFKGMLETGKHKLVVTGEADPRKMTPPSSTPWINRGKIAFVSRRDGNQEIYIMNTDGSEQRRLTNNPAEDKDPAWSPDGRRIAFRSKRDGNAEIYLMNRDGSEQTNLTNNPGYDGDYSWSPDGKKIAFVRYSMPGSGEVFVVNCDGTGLQQITTMPASYDRPCWSPNGSKLALPVQGGIDIVNCDGTGRRVLLNHDKFIGSPTWSPDGSMVAFEMTEETVLDLYVIGSDGKGLKRLTKRGSDDVKPYWLSNGKGIAAKLDSWGEGFEILLVNADNSKETRVTRNRVSEIDFSWSPDGKKVAFSAIKGINYSGPEGNLEIYVVDTTTGEQLNLTNHPAHDTEPAWSPNLLGAAE